MPDVELLHILQNLKDYPDGPVRFARVAFDIIDTIIIIMNHDSWCLQSHGGNFSGMLDIISHRKPAHDHVSVANGLNLDKQVGRIMKITELKSPCKHRRNLWWSQSRCRGHWGSSPPGYTSAYTDVRMISVHPVKSIKWETMLMWTINAKQRCGKK